MHFGQPEQEQQEKPQGDENKSLYEIIGLPTTATTNQITKHFRKRAVKEHPDKGGDPAKYRELSEAYQILKDPVKRDLYDKYGMEGVKAGGDPNGGDFFSNIFGGGQQNQGPRKCKPKLVKINIDLVDAFHGVMKQQIVTRIRTCEKCEGKGGANSKQCPGCKGARLKEKLVMLGPGMYTKTAAPCDDCKGQGVIFDQKDKCENCKGERVIESSKTFQIPIEPGVPHQNDIIFTGEADEYPGALAGDLYFRVFINPNQQFKRKGADLYITKKISLLQSLTGVTFEVKLLDNHTIICSTAPGEILSNHEKKIIKHKGMPFYKQPMSKGHLVVTFDIEYPKPGEVNDKDYARIAAILRQPLENKVERTENVKVLEDYHQQHAHHEEQNEEQGQPQGIQCQSQ